MKKVTKAIIPVAGLGTRFLPFTKELPKEMLPIIDQPAIQYIIEEAVASGIKDILLITSATKTVIVNHFDRNRALEDELTLKGKTKLAKDIRDIANLARVFSIRQQEPLGLGHAILEAKDFVGDEPFALLLGDDVIYNDKVPALKQLINQYEKYDASILGVQKVNHSEVSSYGVINPGKELDSNTYEIIDVQEKPRMEDAKSDLAIVGRYILKPEIFKFLSEKNVDLATNEIQLTDSILKLITELNQKVIGCQFEGKRYDLGSKVGFLHANIDYALRDPDLKDLVKKMIKEENE